MRRPRVVELAVHGRGRGHSSEVVPIARALRARHDIVRVVAGGDALTVFANDPMLVPVACFGPGKGLGRRFAARVRDDVARLRASRPDVLITDGDAPSMHAAKLLSIPVVAVGHGLVFSHARLECGLARAARLREAVNSLSSSWLADRCVAVHFAPIEACDPKTFVAHVPLRASLSRENAPSDFLVAYFRDGGGDAWLEALSSAGERVVLFGAPRPALANVETRPRSEAAFSEALSRAKGVVGTTGANLVAEAFHLGIPMLALHAQGDVEQEANARIVEQEGRGTRGVIARFDPGVCEHFLATARVALARGRREPASLPGTSLVAATLEAIDSVLGARVPRTHRRDAIVGSA